MHAYSTFWCGIFLSLLLTVPGRAEPSSPGPDSDRDGLPDAVEAILGTDKGFAEPLVTLGTFKPRSKDHPELDVVRVDFAAVAQDRWLWAIHFAKPYVADNSNLIIYLDADNDPNTGRKGMGCEVMLGVNRGQGSATGFAPDGSNVRLPRTRVAVVGGVLYICHDLPIRQHEGRSVFRFSVLSETREPHRSVGGTPAMAVTGPARSDRPKILLLDDITADENFSRTEGLDLVWKLQAEPGNVALSSVTAELQEMKYYDTEYRWPAVYGNRGRITVTVPRGGTFYPAVVVYDTAGSEAYELQVDGRRVGRFVAAEDDNRQRIHFLSQPIAFRGGEKLTFLTGSVGNHITEDILLLQRKPPVRSRAFYLSNVEAGYAERDGKGQLRLTWITTWPAACTIEYGPTGQYGQKYTEPQPVANHRVFLADVKPGTTVHYRITAAKPDGSSAISDSGEFAFQAPAAPAGTVQRQEVRLKVENPYEGGLKAFPVTSGVPFASGELGTAEHARLLDSQGREAPAQVRATVRWKDGSVKWLLVTFLADAPAKKTTEYRLEYGIQVRRQQAATSLAVKQQDVLTVDTGPLRAEFNEKRSCFPARVWFDANGDRQFSADEEWTGLRAIAAEIVDDRQARFAASGPVERIEVEESGPVRTVIKTTGHYAGSTPQFRFAYINRFVFYAGAPFVRMYHTWRNESEASGMTAFRSIGLQLPSPSGSDTIRTLGIGAKNLTGGGDVAVYQMRDNAYSLETPDKKNVRTQPGRADGWLDASSDRWGVTIAVRDFWQLYPKALRTTADSLFVDLCPPFADGTYDDCSKLDEIKLYYYLMGGRYRIARGVQKQHELLLAFHPGKLTEQTRQLVQAFQEPLIAVCPPERYCDTRVFGEILPATAGRTPEYEKVCEDVYKNYTRRRESSHEYGMLNFGDQWGERRVNWANGEYDHHHAMLMQFIRSGDRRWYFIADRTARHAIDVDTCHDGPRKGVEWIHSMGHTGGYFRTQHEDNGIPGPGSSVSHTWTEGFCDWYALSGDPTAAENAVLVADYYDGAYLNNYDWGNCRTNGWHLLLTMATYRLTGDPFYLNAARIIVARTVERQGPTGGWQRQLVPGHCHDMPRHRGEANFMLGVLANGLEEYYREVPDPAVKKAILGGAVQAVRELWVPESDGFRYTSCPNMKGYTANNDMTSEILFFAHRLGGDVEFANIGRRAMAAAFRGGIGSMAHLRWTPHIIYNLDLLRQAEAKAKPAGKP